MSEQALRQAEAALDAAYVAHTAHNRRAVLVWEAMKQNPAAPLEAAVELADRFIAWDNEHTAVIDAAIAAAQALKGVR